MRFKHKPIVINAVQFQGLPMPDCFQWEDGTPFCMTPDGPWRLKRGDWICENDLKQKFIISNGAFFLNYERADSADSETAFINSNPMSNQGGPPPNYTLRKMFP